MHQQASNTSERRHHCNETPPQLNDRPRSKSRFWEKESHKMNEASKYVYRYRIHYTKHMIICLCNLLFSCHLASTVIHFKEIIL